jgi:hypothetical protein
MLLLEKKMKPLYELLEFKNLDKIQEEVLKIITDKYGPLDKPGSNGCKCMDNEMFSKVTQVDSLMDELDERGWLKYVQFMKIFVIEPVGEMAQYWKEGGWPIHTDGVPERKFEVSVNDYRLVIPIYNTEGTYTRFFDCEDEGTFVHEPGNENQYKLYDASTCVEIDKYELTKPVLIYTKHPHSVDGPTNDKFRISMGINFNTDINFYQ